MEVKQLIDLYEKRKAEKSHKLLNLLNGSGSFMVMQSLPSEMWGRCNTVEEVFQNNLKYYERMITFQYSDDVPYMEPWIGTGVYANAFGSEILWREDNAPDAHYRYHKIEELAAVKYPIWQDVPMMKMTLDVIRRLKEGTDGKLPISLTDTQSPFDTASLVLDSCEFFTACYTDPEIVHDFMQKLTDLLIEFSKVQQNEIGKECFVGPGHIFPSLVGLRGIAISDDNLAVASPDINQMVSLPYNKQIADAFDGIAIHSCGQWDHTMKMLKGDVGNIMMIDCALDLVCDPNPNIPENVRDSLKGTGIVAKVRMGVDMKKNADILQRLAHPDLPLIVQIDYDGANAAKNYQELYDILEKLYA
jgi:hypothetical protein